MRKKSYKGRCEKRTLSKCNDVCRTYDPIQSAYADMLEADEEIKEIRCNVVLDALEEGEYMSDFLCVKVDNDLMVRECVQRKPTIRYYLCLYLAYQDISVFAPKKKEKNNELSKDEKNIRWALNKYFYTKNKNSLKTAYTMMLKEKYCDGEGVLFPEYPTFHQFRYFYRKHKNMQTFYISRDGLKDYQRNNRPLLGDGVQEFAPNVGVGMFDSTICDIYLVDDSGNLVGRPILTACVDAYSSICYY